MQASLVTTLAFATALVSLPPRQGTRLAEPAQEFVLQANGKELDLRIGHPAELPKEFNGQKVTLRVRPTRLFDYQGLRFRYPQSYAWEYEAKESGGQFVTLSGHTNVLILQFYDDQQDPARQLDKLAASIAAQLGSKTKTSACELVGKEKRKLAGKHLEVLASGAKTTQEVYAVPLGGEVALLVVQDTCTEDGKPDPETVALLQLFADTLEWPK
jgi:hypothetical protein